MNSKILFTTSAIFMGLMGLLLTFFPKEILTNLDSDIPLNYLFILQLLGALYLGFAMQNWLVKGSIVGGIYNKPILFGNVMHFAVASLALLKTHFSLELFGYNFSIPLIVLYSIFAISFIILNFTAPKALQKT